MNFFLPCESILICFLSLSGCHIFFFSICPFARTWLSVFYILFSHCGIPMHSPAVSGCVSWLRPRSPSPEREYGRLTWALNVVKMTRWQLKWMACHMSFFSLPLVNSSIRTHTIYERNLEDIWGCKLSHRDPSNSTYSIQFAFLCVCVCVCVCVFLSLPSRLWMVLFCCECRRKNKSQELKGGKVSFVKSFEEQPGEPWCKCQWTRWL